ncbi:MAG: hypothetical protein WCO90_08395 [Planctomycetota bacterium]
MNAAAPDVVLLGNLLVDDIVLRDARTLMAEPGGAVLHAALAASLWGARVGICSITGTDYPAAALAALASRGIDLAPMPLSRQFELAHGLAPPPGLQRLVSLDPFELVREGTFAGGFLAGLVTHGDVGRSIEQGIVAASFAIENWGSRGLMAASPAAAVDRHTEWFARSPVEASA